MDRATHATRIAAWLAPWAILLACGCQTVKVPEESVAAMSVPRELNKVSLPTYVVEPPDLLIVEVLDALPGRPITGEHLVRPDGTISLGFYGDIYVAGLSLPEVKEKVVLHLREYLNDDALGLWKKKDDDWKKIEPRDSDTVYVDVASFNSKFYYVEGDVAMPGRMPSTGNETVLDALHNAGGLMPTAAPQNIRLVRPAPPGSAHEQTLPVNLAAIVSGGDTTTNYQLMPGDRLVVYRDPIVRTTIFIDRLAAPFQTVINSMLQTTFVIRNTQFIRAGVSPATGAGTSASTTNTPGVIQPGAR